MPTNKVKLEICGARYIISSTDDEEYMLTIAQRLDKDMNEFMNSSPTASITTAAVLTALNYLDELEKSTNGADNMRSQIRDYLEDASKAKMAAEEARREVDRLRRELTHLKEAR